MDYGRWGVSVREADGWRVVVLTSVFWEYAAALLLISLCVFRLLMRVM